MDIWGGYWATQTTKPTQNKLNPENDKGLLKQRKIFKKTQKVPKPTKPKHCAHVLVAGARDHLRSTGTHILNNILRILNHKFTVYFDQARNGHDTFGN